jgi:hypothetical protein
MQIIQKLIFSQQRRFIEFLAVICLFPLGNFIGETFNWMWESRTVTAVIYFAFNRAYLFCLLVAHFLKSYLFASCVCIPQATAASWADQFFRSFPFIRYSAICGLYAHSPDRWESRLQSDDFLGNCVSSVRAFHTNTVFAALYTAMTASDLVSVVKFWFFIDSADQFAFLAVIFIVSGIIWCSVTNCIVKGVKLYLYARFLEGIEVISAITPSGTNDRYVTLPDVERRQHFLDLGLHFQIKKARLYLRIGISNHCDIFIDWSLARFFLEHHSHDVGILYQHAICSVFPMREAPSGILLQPRCQQPRAERRQPVPALRSPADQGIAATFRLIYDHRKACQDAVAVAGRYLCGAQFLAIYAEGSVRIVPRPVADFVDERIVPRNDREVAEQLPSVRRVLDVPG